jgi:hypothetical protein
MTRLLSWLLSLFRRREVLPNPDSDDRSSIERFRKIVGGSR